MKNFKLILCLVLLSAFTKVTAQQIGDLDSTFNFNGKVIKDFGGDDGASAIAIQPDGKIVSVGYSAIGNNGRFALSRHNSDGSADTTFGGTGMVITDFAAGYDMGACISLQTDGKILAGGMKWTSGKGDCALMRYNDDGSLDTTFGIGGKVEHPVGTGDAGITALAIQPDGKIVASSMCTFFSTGRDFAVIRYNSDGSMDNTFGTGGIVTFDFLTSYDFAFAIALQSDGKIIAGGASGQDPFYDFALARFDSTGAVDTSFGTLGKVTTDFGKPDDWPYGMALQTDGKIVLAGSSGSPYKIALSRYNDDGNLDTTFNSTGKVLANVTSHDEGNAVALQTDGKIIVAGVSYAGSNQEFSIFRFNTDGSVDTSFSTNGNVQTDFGSNTDKAKAVAIQADGKIVAAGVSGQNFALARYLTVVTAGLVDFESMNNSVLIYPNPVTENATLTYTLKQADNISIMLIDANGRLIKTIIENQLQTSGEYHQNISLPAGLAKGIYFITISNGSQQMSIQIVK